ncbi:hypothetical protein HN51_029570 [Arachis hypogaea]
MGNDDLETVLSIPLKKTDLVEHWSSGTRWSVEGTSPFRCIHYFKCLSMVEPLFSSLSSDTDPIIFVWYDALNPEHENGVSSQRNGIQLEKAAVLFNLGAICSQIAASCDRTTALGCHLAMEAFKVAGNFFFQLWKVFAKDVVSATLDLTLLFAEFLHVLFAAQASELELKQQLNNNEASYALQQHRCSQHNIHLEKASVLFNLGALCTHIALSCDLTTIQGHRLAMDALIDASNWFYLLRFESKKASGTIDLSESYAIAIANWILGFTLNFPPHPQSICFSLCSVDIRAFS